MHLKYLFRRKLADAGRLIAPRRGHSQRFSAEKKKKQMIHSGRGLRKISILSFVKDASKDDVYERILINQVLSSLQIRNSVSNSAEADRAGFSV